ncbi:MAG TPA: hypothetical protein VGL77_13025, partial [Armatimonadota bacterium]
MAAAVRSLDFADLVVREQLVKQLISTRPLESFKALNAFSILSDAIPESCLAGLARWSVEYITFPNQRSGWRAAPLSFWGPILSVYTVSTHVYDLLHPAVMSAAKRPIDWRVDDQRFLREYLLRAPIHLALEAGEAMLEVTVTNDSIESKQRWEYLYNASLNRPEFLHRFKKYLLEAATNPVLTHFNYYLDNPNDTSPARDDEELRNYCRQRIISQTDKVLQRSDKSHFEINGNSHQFIDRVSWSGSDLSLVNKLVDAINHSMVSSFEVIDFLSCLANLVERGGRSFADPLRKSYLSWLNKTPTGISLPFIDGVGKDEIVNPLCLLSVQMVKAFEQESEIIRAIGNWIINNVIEATLQSSGTLPYLAIRVGTMTNGPMGISIVNTVQLFLLRAREEQDHSIETGKNLRSLLKTVSFSLHSTSAEEWTVA